MAANAISRPRENGNCINKCLNLHMSSTNLHAKISQEDVRDKVLSLGGSFDVNLTTSTTHLVAASFDTEKYRVATGMKVHATIR